MDVNGNAVALWVGCYTSDMDGRGEGIVALGRDADGGYAALGSPTAVQSPSFLALHPTRPVLYAVSEGSQQVHAFRYDDRGALSRLGETGAAGELVCHVAVAPDGAFLVVSCWGDGSVMLFELDEDGALGRRHVSPASVDPSGEDRESRAHSCLILGDGRFVTAEMGHDLLRCWRFSAERGVESHGTVALPYGCGPRHFAQNSAGVVYVNTEYSGEVAMLAPCSGSAAVEVGPWLELRGMFAASATGTQPDDAAAEICLDPAQENLYVSVRGSNRICRLALDGDGTPTPVAESSCGGNWPRHHCFEADRIVIALQHSDALASFALDADGNLTPAPQLLRTGSPTCVVAHR